MSQSSFSQALLASACVTGAIFSATTLPFAALKSNVVNIEVQNKPVFTSELQYLAAPYLAVAGGMSLAVGASVFGLLGWRNSGQKLASTAATNQDLAQRLAAQQLELEQIKFSDARLQSKDLSHFLMADQDWSTALAPSQLQSMNAR
ncbi:MAG: hypothetical protein VKI82_03130 [Leptolyngbya sp.]|nr:hypothetical protein [Leptolyngbya sp.]